MNKHDMINTFSSYTEAQLVIGAKPADLCLFYKAEPQRLVGMTNDVDACVEVAKDYKLGNTPWMFVTNYSAVASFSDDIQRAWATEDSARTFMTGIIAVMSPGAVFYGTVLDGTTRCARTNTKPSAPFGIRDGELYMVFKSSFKTLAKHVGFCNITINMIPNSEMFSFSMFRPM